MYVVGALVMAGGCGASIGGAIWHSLSGIGDMQRVIIPGAHELELAARSHTIYWESRSVVDGTAYINPGNASVRCGLSTASGESVDIRNASISEEYTFGSYHGESLFELDIVRPGTYRLSCEVSGGTTSEGVLAIGRGMALGGIMIGMVGAVFAFGIGLFIILRTYSRRKPPPGVYGYAPHGPGYGPPGPGQGAPGHGPPGPGQGPPQGYPPR
jgi:hypothetical protein